ncbi:MAG: hypothetical protein HY554_06485 [Elusimicrobia bacterium]|nr:hypothetical protein [Elusimicrobiota bacterium]
MSYSFRLAAIVLCAAAASASSAEIPALAFDADAEQASALSFVKDSDPAPLIAATRSGLRARRACEAVEFKPGGAPRSPVARLKSGLYREECSTRRTWCRRFGERRRCTERSCRDELVDVVVRDAVVELSGPWAPWPWERDVFQLCLQGERLAGAPQAPSHRYGEPRLRTEGLVPPLTVVEFPVLAKIPTAPDPAGIEAVSFSYDRAAGRLRLVIKDRWAAEYAGEKTGLRLRLKRNVVLWPDEVVVELKLESDTAAERQIVFPAARAGRYWVEWEFSRRGNVSLPDAQIAKPTTRVDVAPAAG